MLMPIVHHMEDDDDGGWMLVGISDMELKNSPSEMKYTKQATWEPQPKEGTLSTWEKKYNNMYLETNSIYMNWH